MNKRERARKHFLSFSLIKGLVSDANKKDHIFLADLSIASAMANSPETIRNSIGRPGTKI